MTTLQSNLRVSSGASLQAASTHEAIITEARERLDGVKQKLCKVVQTHLHNPDLEEIIASGRPTLFPSTPRATRTPPSCLARICQAISSKARSILSTISNMFSRIFNLLTKQGADYCQVRRDSDTSSDLSSRSSSPLVASSSERFDSDATDDAVTTQTKRPTLAQRLNVEITQETEYDVWKSNRVKDFILPSRQVCKMIIDGGKVEEQFCLKKALKLNLRQDECGTVEKLGAELVDRILNLETPASISTGKLAVLLQKSKGFNRDQ